MIHHNRTAMENGIAVASTGYFPSPSGLVSNESQAGVAYDYRAPVDTLGVQQHSLGMNVSLIDAPPSKSANEQHPRTPTAYRCRYSRSDYYQASYPIVKSPST